MIRIVIADDHTIMREGLKRILDGADDIEVVGEAVDGFEVLAQVRKGGFDLLMLDLSMPGRSGVELIRQIKDEVPKLPILILTMHEEEQYAVRAIRAGARGYLTKESAGDHGNCRIAAPERKNRQHPQDAHPAQDGHAVASRAGPVCGCAPAVDAHAALVPLQAAASQTTACCLTVHHSLAV
jgi:DNA-binding NarL/FixJ family response regulator